MTNIIPTLPSEPQYSAMANQRSTLHSAPHSSMANQRSTLNSAPQSETSELSQSKKKQQRNQIKMKLVVNAQPVTVPLATTAKKNEVVIIIAVAKQINVKMCIIVYSR